MLIYHQMPANAFLSYASNSRNTAINLCNLHQKEKYSIRCILEKKQERSRKRDDMKQRGM